MRNRFPAPDSDRKFKQNKYRMYNNMFLVPGNGGYVVRSSLLACEKSDPTVTDSLS